MALWGNKENRERKKRKLGAKVLIYGLEGTGKTRFALGFPNSAYIDTETGAGFYDNDGIAENATEMINLISYREYEKALAEIIKNNEDLGFTTLVTDSVSKIRENMEEVVMTVEEARARRDGKQVEGTNISQRSWGRIKYLSCKHQNMKITLSSKGVIVLDIAQAKPISDEQRKARQDYFLTHVGYDPVMSKQAKFDYDLILYMYAEADLEDQDRVVYKALVIKDRINRLPQGTVIDNPTFEMWADKILPKGKKDQGVVRELDFVHENEEDKEYYEQTGDETAAPLSERMKKLIDHLKKNDKEAYETFAKEWSAISNKKLSLWTKEELAKGEQVYSKYASSVK